MRPAPRDLIARVGGAMLIWFAVAAPVLVAEVFRSPMIDFRLVAVGSLLPLVDVALGRPSLAHTMIGPVLVLAAVMATTVNRRLVRRRWLGLPIGLLVHLVLDGTWTNAHLFAWPMFGFGLSGESVPEVSASPVLLVALEVVGVGLGVWAWRRYGLDDAGNRRLLIRSGHLNRRVLG